MRLAPSFTAVGPAGLARPPVGPPGLPDALQAPARSGRSRRHSSRAAPAAVAAAAAEPPTVTCERAGGSTSAPPICNNPVPTSWLAYSWRVNNTLSLGRPAADVERLRRQLGWGGRWAWEWEDEEEASDSDTEEAADDEEQPCGSCSSERMAVLSSRGAGRRRSSRRRCRGQPLAGAAVYAQARPWAMPDDPLPPELQRCLAGQLLTAKQEAWLGELVQAGKQAHVQQQEQQQQQQRRHVAEPAVASSSGSLRQHQRRLLGPEQQWEQVVRRGAAAQQVLFDANLRLVQLARRQLLGNTQLPAALQQELCIGGRDALWRAAAGYLPNRHTRFSTYAVAAILNAMRDSLSDQRRLLVHVPRQAAAWAQQVFGAAAALQQARNQGATAGEQQAALATTAQQEQQQQQAGSPQQEQAGLGLLAAAAQLAPRQVMHALAAGRRQRLAGFDCVVPEEPVSGASWRNQQQQLVPFGDVQQDECQASEDDGSIEAAREAVQLVLSSLHPRKHAAVLRLRFGLEEGDASGAGSASSSSSDCVPALGAELDFTSLGRCLGVSRQRAQQLYHAAVAAARQEAAATGMVT